MPLHDERGQIYAKALRTQLIPVGKGAGWYRHTSSEQRCSDCLNTREVSFVLRDVKGTVKVPEPGGPCTLRPLRTVLLVLGCVGLLGNLLGRFQRMVLVPADGVCLKRLDHARQRIEQPMLW